jgi:phage-related protein
MSDTAVKPVFWIGSSYKGFRAFPDFVQDEMGFALYQAQIGEKHRNSKPLKGFGGAGVLEIVTDHVGDTYRAVYTVKFATAVYVLHAFQKKSKSGIKTPTEDLEMIQRRLKTAEADHKAQSGKGKAS